MMTTAELADYLMVPESTVVIWRSRHTGPTFYRVGRHVRYRREDVEAWLDANTDVKVRSKPEHVDPIVTETVRELIEQNNERPLVERDAFENEPEPEPEEP